jgi:hypothetical protein
MVEGVLHSLSLDDHGDERDIALQAPIRVTDASGEMTWSLPALSRLVVPARELRYVTVIEAPERQPANAESS